MCPLELGEKLKNPEMNMKLAVNVSPLGADFSHCRRRTSPWPALTYHLSLSSLLLFYYMYIPHSGLKLQALGCGSFFSAILIVTLGTEHHDDSYVPTHFSCLAGPNIIEIPVQPALGASDTLSLL